VIVLLSGDIRIGKTSVCEKLVALAQAQGRQLRGVLTPALYSEQGDKVGFEALDVSDGDRWNLARTEGDLGGPRVGAYTFDAAALERAIALLRAAIHQGSDLLIIDEIGPLELFRGGGFAPILEELPLQGPGHILLVVRRALVEELRRRLGAADVVIYTATLDNRDDLPRRIVQELWAGEWPVGG
jgi:nucleoside-triphosphatase